MTALHEIPLLRLAALRIAVPRSVNATGLALTGPRLARLDVDGVEHPMDPQTPDLLDAHRCRARDVFLLPGFDKFVLGYQDRRAALPAEFADRIVPGGNGMFRPTVVSRFV